jgi:diaminopimelate epimerase
MAIPQKIKFKKMSGAGNDFILIDNLNGRYALDWSQIAPKLCDRRNGIGADGLLIIERSTKADFKMNYFNADGTYGGMCGNGGRCSALFISILFSHKKVSFEALEYVYHAAQLDNTNVMLRMKDVISFELNKMLQIDETILPVHFIDTGSPHVVLYINDLPSNIQSEVKTDGIIRLGRLIRNHRQFKPHGVNVNFVEIADNKNISMRTYERGVEDETYACGTGAIASSIVSSVRKGINHPVNVKTHSNELLIVDFIEAEGRFKEVTLTGPAISTFEGEIQI